MSHIHTGPASISSSPKAIAQQKAHYILSRYKKGQKTFTQVKLRGAGVQVVAPNLEQVNLANTNLPDIGLTSSTLCQAVLDGANLRRADFSQADLTDASLQNADLSKANLNGAIFRRASLVGADLTGASVVRADFSHANLTNAIVDMQALKQTILTGATLPDGSVHD
jgi:uncharacterized protein YjbI with pentapeptide repeats